MSAARTLVDTNVIVAAVEADHPHHLQSAALFTDNRSLSVAAHSCAEAFDTLTRRGTNAPFGRPADKAWASLAAVLAVTDMVGLTAAQTLDTIRSFAERGGIGARLYDRLIGEVAVRNGIPAIVTWNVGHMRGLFPDLSVLTPPEMSQQQGRTR